MAGGNVRCHTIPYRGMTHLRVLWLLLTMKPASMTWRRWLRMNRVVQRALRANRLRNSL